MNKKDFLALVVCNLGTLALLIEHWCGVGLALKWMCIWTLISMIIHVCVLRNYLRIDVTVVEE